MEAEKIDREHWDRFLSLLIESVQQAKDFTMEHAPQVAQDIVLNM